MYEREVEAVLRFTVQAGPTSARVETIRLWDAFPVQISPAKAHEIWMQVVSKMGLLQVPQRTQLDRIWHFP